jgi:hypothetical protein
MIDEIEFYDQLFEKFYTLNDDPIKVELWKNQQIMEIMKKLDNHHNSHFVQNALIVIMALFSDYHRDPFYTNTKSVKDLNDERKEDVIELLQDEIFS